MSQSEVKGAARSTLVFLASFAALFVNSQWGLQSDDRRDLLGGRELVESRSSQLVEISNRIKEDSVAGLTPEEIADWGTRTFLLNAWAADDTFVLGAIKNMKPKEMKFDPGHYIYGGGLIYMGAAFLQAAAWVGYVEIRPDQLFYLENPSEVGKINGVLRFMIVLFATVGICLVYRHARAEHGGFAAVLAWGILLVAPVTHQAARTVEPHIYVLPFFVISLSCIVGSLRRSKGGIRKCYLISAAFAGLAIGTQSTCWYIVACFVASLWIHRRRGTLDTRAVCGYFVMYGVVSVAALLVANPYYVLNYSGFREDLSRGAKFAIGNTGHGWAPYELSWFLIVFLGAAILYHLIRLPRRYRRSETSIVYLAGIVPAILWYLFISDASVPYVFSAVAMAAILGGIMLRDLFLAVRGIPRGLIAGMMAILFAVFPAGRSAYYVINFTAEDREAAGAWINANIPAGSTIGVRLPLTHWDSVPFRFHEYDLVDHREVGLSEAAPPPDAIVLMLAELPEGVRGEYELVKTFESRSLFGYRYALGGEMHALVGKRVDIYERIAER